MNFGIFDALFSLSAQESFYADGCRLPLGDAAMLPTAEDSTAFESPSPTGLQELPTELLSEIALHGVCLPAFRCVVRFDVATVAATRIQRWFRQLYAEEVTISKRPWPTVGDRVMFRWPTTSSRKPCVATVVAHIGFRDGRPLWRIAVLGEKSQHSTSVKVCAARIRRLDPWADTRWHDSVGRTSSIAAADVARAAATRSTSAAMAAMSNAALSPAETALAVAAASAACAAAAAATLAATAAASSVPRCLPPRRVLPAGSAAAAVVAGAGPAPPSAHIA